MRVSEIELFNFMSHDATYVALPDTGTAMEVAPGVRWVRMGLPFALNHINLWLLADETITAGGSVRRGWTIVDNRGNRVSVALADMQTGLQLADSLFKNDSPDPASIRRQNN